MAYYPDNIASTVASQLGDAEILRSALNLQARVAFSTRGASGPDSRQIILMQSVEAGRTCKGGYPNVK